MTAGFHHSPRLVCCIRRASNNWLGLGILYTEWEYHLLKRWSLCLNPIFPNTNTDVRSKYFNYSQLTARLLQHHIRCQYSLSMSCCSTRRNPTFCQVDDAPSAQLCGLSIDKDISHLMKAKWFHLRNRNWQQQKCSWCEFEESTWKASLCGASFSRTNWLISSVWTAPGHRLTEATPLFLSSNPISAASRSHCDNFVQIKIKKQKKM